MSNGNAPFGFRQARHVTGTGHRMNLYTIASTLAENIAIGDLVKSDGSGGIQKAAAGDAIAGTFLGYSLESEGISGANYGGSPQGTIPFFKAWVSGTVVPAGMVARALVADDPFETFEVQTSNTIAAADIGSLCNLVDAAPDMALGVSRQTVGAPGGAASQFRIERILSKPTRIADANNNTSGYDLSGPGQYAIVEVKPMKHERGGAAMGVAV